MTQKNLTHPSGTTREIRRTQIKAAHAATRTGGQTPMHFWEVKLDSGWQKMEPQAVQGTLSRALGQGLPKQKYTTRRGEVDFEYEVFFATMTQKNLTHPSGTTREIR